MGRNKDYIATYLDADKYVVLNDNDPDLTPIVLRLPNPPDIKLIDGYGLPPAEQKFHRLEVPDGLRRIENRAVEELSAEKANNANKTVTIYKIQKKFWSILEKDFKKYEAEIAFIKRFWWHRIHGYWFFNRGKPTYITGWHFFYLNVWTMNTTDGSGKPEYRDRDRKEFLLKLYAFTTTETFNRIDDEGFAIPEEDGSYEMKDLGRRICYGVGQSKNRRSGNTNKGLSDCTEIVMRSEMNDGMYIFNDTGENAKKHFDKKMMPSFAKLPLWIKPLSTSGQNASSIQFQTEKNDYGTGGLNTQIAYAEQGGDKAVDGLKLMSVLLDEEGKDKQNTSKRWEVIKNCLAQADGRIIHGWAYHPSTVAEMTEGGISYRILLEASKFYRRMPDGQTESGIFRLFIPSDEGFDDFIDPWGYSIKDKIEPYQAELGFKEIAHEVLQAKRDFYLKLGTAEAMRSYRHQKKLYPLKYADSWLGQAGDIGFPLEKIDQRQAELRRYNIIEIGNLKWKDNKFGGDVEFEEDLEHGRFEVSRRPPSFISNQRTQIEFYSVFENKVVLMYQPRFMMQGVLGADPFKFLNEMEDRRSRTISGTQQSKLSRGGIAGLLCKSESDEFKPMSEWEGYRFTLSYCHRSNSDDYNEDLLKAAIWTGYMVYPETNIGTIHEYFIKNKFAGYLIYDIDQYTGQKKKTPGVVQVEGSKQKLFALTKEYLEFRSHIECHASYLTECQLIKGLEQMTHFDRFTSHGLSLLGAQSLYPSRATNNDEQAVDMGNFLETWSY